MMARAIIAPDLIMAIIISFPTLDRLPRPAIRHREPVVTDADSFLRLLDQLNADILADARAVAAAINWPELATINADQASDELVRLIDRPDVIAALEASHH